MSASIQIAGNSVSIKGPLNVETVTALLKDTPAFSATETEINMTDTTEIDSAGLALLVFWEGQIKQKGGSVIFKGVPSQAASLMQISGLTHMSMPG